MRHIISIACLIVVVVIGSGSARADGDDEDIVVDDFPGGDSSPQGTATDKPPAPPAPPATCPCPTATPVATPPRRTRTPRKPVKPPQKAVEGKPGPRGPAGPAGPQGPAGPKGEDGADGASSVTLVVDEPPGTNCPAGGQRVLVGIDADSDGLAESEATSVSYVCNGVAGKAGGNGRDGYSRVQLNIGVRFASIVSDDRPTGWSVAPEVGIKLWFSQTFEGNFGAAWAPGLDRNMVVTGTVCRRGIGSRFGLCLGGQYIGWSLEGGRALWHSGLGIATLKVVPIETRHFDISLEAGGGIGFDGYDADMQFAYGATGQGTLTLKF